MYKQHLLYSFCFIAVSSRFLGWRHFQSHKYQYHFSRFRGILQESRPCINFGEKLSDPQTSRCFSFEKYPAGSWHQQSRVHDMSQLQPFTVLLGRKKGASCSVEFRYADITGTLAHLSLGSLTLHLKAENPSNEIFQVSLSVDPPGDSKSPTAPTVRRSLTSHSQGTLWSPVPLL